MQIDPRHKRLNGFTIVELLIAVAVIGILAAITTVAYNGIQQSAKTKSVMSDLNSANDTLELYRSTNNQTYPNNLSTISNGGPLAASLGTTYQYYQNGTTYCLTGTNGTVSYSINQEGSVSYGVCPVLYFDANLASSYSGTGTTVNDLSGSGIIGTLVNGTGYDGANSGSFIFDGVSNRLETTYKTVSNEMTWSACFYGTANVNTFNMFMGSFLPYFSFYGGNKVFFSNYIGGVQRSLTSSTNLSINNWYCTMFTTKYDGANTTMSVYVNGSPAGSGTWPGSQTVAASGFTVGDGRTGTSWYPFKGKVSDVKIFNRAFSADEVKQQFNIIRGDYGL